MKFFDRAVERFCYKHPKFGIRNLMLYIIIGTFIVYLVGWMDTTGTLYSYLYFSLDGIKKGEVWRLVSFLFIPPYGNFYSNILYTLLALYFYYMIGAGLERHWGKGRFTIYYLSGVVFTIIYGLIIGALGLYAEDISSHYLNLSLFFAFATLWPDTEFRVLFIFPVKAKWLALVDGLLFVVSMILYRTLLPAVLLLNYLLFFAYKLVEKFVNVQKASARQSQFNAAVHRAQYNERMHKYRHRCEVCGKTDVSDPDMDFRYCSRCQGYHCFCMEHINSHTHFTE